MGKQDWAPEPWKLSLDERGVVCANNTEGVVRDWVRNFSKAHAEGNARRIIACVNACAGVPTEDLESVLCLGKDILRYIIERRKEPPDAE